MKIAVITALWGRPRVSSIMLDSLAVQSERLKGTLDLEVVAVGSEGEWSAWLAESCGAIYTSCENKPLGRKWQTALARARRTDPDAVIVLGSDNLVNDELLTTYALHLGDGADYIAIMDAHQYNTTRKTLIHWPGYEGKRLGEPIGSGRCFSRSLLERMNWRLWDDHYVRGLDSSTTAKLQAIEHRAERVWQFRGDVRHLGIKVSGAMSPSLHKHRTSSPIPLDMLRCWFGGELGARILALGS
jgi:hypothetical protein